MPARWKRKTPPCRPSSLAADDMAGPVSEPLRAAARIIRDGGIVAYPTEAVYGLGCDPASEAAVQRLLALKQRPVSKGLILLGASAEQLRPWIDVTDEQLAHMQASWPGPTTWVVPASDRTPAWVRGDHDGVAVRVAGHALARALAQASGTPIISTSANLSGQAPARTAADVLQQLGSMIDGLVPGQCDLAAKPSTIVELVTGRILRG